VRITIVTSKDTAATSVTWRPRIQEASVFNIKGGAIPIGQPYGMTGARCVGHALLEGKRQKAKYACVTMCIGGGMGAAGLFEIC
jgi:acetyl-CoA acetyltransferase